MRWLGYAWTVAVNCFYLIGVFWAFNQIYNRHDLEITVAILGLIYVAIRTISMFQFAAMFEMLSQTKKQLLQLQKFVRRSALRHKSERVGRNRGDQSKEPR